MIAKKISVKNIHGEDVPNFHLRQSRNVRHARVMIRLIAVLKDQPF